MGHVQSEMIKTFTWALCAFVVASFIAWGVNFAWLAFYLGIGKDDSYWDRAPHALELFVPLWMIFAFGAAIVAAWYSRRPR